VTGSSPRAQLGISWLGLRPYREMLAVQERLGILRREGRMSDLLLLLEHPPVFTLGRRSEPGDLLHDRAFYAARGVTIEATPRGGRVTYHGPGQLVAYPILDLRTAGPQPAGAGRVGVAWFVEVLETAAIRALRRWRIPAGRIGGLTGLWTDRSGPLPPDATAATTTAGVASGRIRKIGSIGLKVSRGITSHGLALNVGGDLAPFGWINSCGIEHCAVTSVGEELDRDGRNGRLAPGPEAFGIALGEELAELLGRDLEPVSPESLGPGGPESAPARRSDPAKA